jgi:SDR family mycofactocin-dependent oxidoreductase
VHEGLTDKVAFITGLARGQGRSHALSLAREGVSIVGLDICDQFDSVDYAMSTPDDLAETVRQVEEAGGKIVARVGDVRDIESIRACLDEGLAAFGRVDFVLANAGIMPIWGRGSDTMRAWQDALDVLLTGVLNTIEATYPRLVEQGYGGSIVITSSMAGVQPMMRTLQGKTLGLMGYCAAKAALVNLCQNYASALARYRIRVNTVHPTGVNTPMVDNDMCQRSLAERDPEDNLTLVSALPAEILEARDISNAVVWLCSDESAFYTGSAMRIDAGASLR